MATKKGTKTEKPAGKKATVRAKLKDLKTTKKVTGGATQKPNVCNIGSCGTFRE